MAVSYSTNYINKNNNVTEKHQWIQKIEPI